MTPRAPVLQVRELLSRYQAASRQIEISTWIRSATARGPEPSCASRE
jgi:hypothetical protein